MRIVLSLLVLVGLSCNEIRDCNLDPDVGYAVVAFFDNDTLRGSKYVRFDEIYADEDFLGAMGDSAVGLQLPLDPEKEYLSYRMVTDSFDYTLALNYKVTALEIYALECAPSFGFAGLILDTLRTNFDSATVNNPTINKNVPLNVSVYF